MLLVLARVGDPVRRGSNGIRHSGVNRDEPGLEARRSGVFREDANRCGLRPKVTVSGAAQFAFGLASGIGPASEPDG